MHHIHRTKGLVIKNLPVKEADKYLTILTRELGLIKVIAQGVRKIESKNRQSIQNYSFSNFALVKGKVGWRLTNVVFVNNFYTEIKNDDLKESIIRVLNLIDRLVAGESEESETFDLVEDFIGFAKDNQDDFEKDAIDKFERIFLLRVLNILGYVDNEKIGNFVNDLISIDLINQSGENLVEVINNAIQESGL